MAVKETKRQSLKAFPPFLQKLKNVVKRESNGDSMEYTEEEQQKWRKSSANRARWSPLTEKHTGVEMLEKAPRYL